MGDVNRGISGANLPALRSHNTALVLGLLRTATVGAGTGISRLELAERTGLTPQAVSKITARLRADGLVDEAGRGAPTGGKPRTLLRLARRARYAAGVHLDRDELTVVLADLAGGVVDARTLPLDLGRPAGEVLEAVAGLVRETVRATPGADGAVLGAGLACPGPLDQAAGVLHRVTGLPGWDGYPLRDALAERLGLPVVLDKDTNAAALAVLPPGGDAAPGAVPGTGDSFGYLHLGTGLGAGLVLDGALHRGARTGAGEFGHQAIAPDGPVCACGNRGCLEALCLAAVGRGDTAEAARLLGVGAANLVSLLDIDRVVLGGRTVLADPGLFAREVAAAMDPRTLRAAGRTVPVTVAPAGRRVVAEGAALLALAPLFGQTAVGRPPVRVRGRAVTASRGDISG
ncbi:ROK family transcriptional regulator [Actinacidiphila glaucinigra]|uniref:ROK family transcriptional regulator n=1 Tax=Actinacidiphila glaucinigra TaxID=235986 RepID=UPI003255219E